MVSQHRRYDSGQLERDGFIDLLVRRSKFHRAGPPGSPSLDVDVRGVLPYADLEGHCLAGASGFTAEGQHLPGIARALEVEAGALYDD